MTGRKTIAIEHRETGEVSLRLDVTGWSPRDLDRMWDGLVYKVDFEKWCPVYSPPRGDDQTLAEWVSA